MGIDCPVDKQGVSFFFLGEEREVREHQYVCTWAPKFGVGYFVTVYFLEVM